jgi:hypothetical protein
MHKKSLAPKRFCSSISTQLAKSSLAVSPKPEASPTLEEMGQAALDFVRRFDMAQVLGNFERELRDLAGERAVGDGVPSSVIAHVGRSGHTALSERQ